MASSSAAVSIACPFLVCALLGAAAAARVVSRGVGERGPAGSSIGRASERETPAHRRLRRLPGRRGPAAAGPGRPSLTLRGRWFLPGGGVQHGENPADALRREIAEESGLTVERRPAARRPLRRAHAARRHEPAHDPADLPGGHWEGTLRPEADGTTDAVGWFSPDSCARSRWPTTSETVVKTTSRERPWAPRLRRRRHHVVIIGSGFGGLFAARALKRAPVRVTLIDRTNHHLFQPLLYQVATGILSEGQIAPAIRDVLRNTASCASCWPR